MAEAARADQHPQVPSESWVLNPGDSPKRVSHTVLVWNLNYLVSLRQSATLDGDKTFCFAIESYGGPT